MDTSSAFILINHVFHHFIGDLSEVIHVGLMATSGEVIDAAFNYFEASWLKTVNWIVVSQRTAEIASRLGVTQIDISRDASDQALIQCAQQLVTRARHS